MATVEFCISEVDGDGFGVACSYTGINSKDIHGYTSGVRRTNVEVAVPFDMVDFSRALYRGLREGNATHGSGGNRVNTLPPVNLRCSSISFGSICGFSPGLCSRESQPSVNIVWEASAASADSGDAALEEDDAVAAVEAALVSWCIVLCRIERDM